MEVKNAKHRRTIIVEPELWGRIQDRAKSQDVSMSWLIRHWSRTALRSKKAVMSAPVGGDDFGPGDRA